MAGDYKVLVRLLVESNEGSVLGAFSRHLLGVERDVDKLTAKIRGLSDVLKGGLQIAGAYELGKGLTEIVDKGNEIVRIQKNMHAAGVSQLEVTRATAEAWKAQANVINITAADALKFANDFRGIFGNQKDATGFVGLASLTAGYTMATQGHDKGMELTEGVMREVHAAFKSGEITGKITPEAMADHVNHLMAMKMAFGDQVSFSQFLTAERAAGMSFRGLDDGAKYGLFAAMSQEMGVRAGTQLKGFFQKFGTASHWTGTALQLGADLGLVDKNYTTGEGAHMKVRDQRAIKDNELAMHDPLAYADKVHAAIQARLDKEHVTDPQKRADRELGYIQRLTNDTSAAAYLTELITQREKWEKDMKLGAEAAAAMSPDAMMRYLNGGYDRSMTDHGFHGAADRAGTYEAPSWDAQVQGFTAKWNSLMQALGAPAVGTAAGMLQLINNAVSGLANAAASHPNTAKSIAEVTAALTGMLAAFGIGNIAKGGAQMLMGQGAFGLRGAATALDGSAAALTRAAGALSGGGAVGAPGGATTKNGGRLARTASTGLKAIPWIAGLAALGDIYGGLEKDALTAVGGDISQAPWWVKANHFGTGDQYDVAKGTIWEGRTPTSELQKRQYADSIAMKRINGGVGPGRSPSGPVNATLQAQVNQTVQHITNLDGKKIAEEVVHIAMPLITQMMTAGMNAMMSGVHNDIASHASPGTVGAN